MMAVTDADPAVRFEVLAALDTRFDSLLVEEDALRLLFQGLQDENHLVREGVLALLGRLAAVNPAAILPVLRDTLLTVLAELEYADAHPDLGSASQLAAAAGGAAGGGGGGVLLASISSPGGSGGGGLLGAVGLGDASGAGGLLGSPSVGRRISLTGSAAFAQVRPGPRMLDLELG